MDGPTVIHQWNELLLSNTEEADTDTHSRGEDSCSHDLNKRSQANAECIPHDAVHTKVLGSAAHP